MKVRAKFTCNTVSKAYQGKAHKRDDAGNYIKDEKGELISDGDLIYDSARLGAASGKGNEQWSKWTPSGLLEMSITNENLTGFFKPGKSYYLDITEVPADEEK